MARILRNFFDVLIAAQERRARARLLETLDERTLRDIGLETEANRRREKSQQALLRFGAY